MFVVEVFRMAVPVPTLEKYTATTADEAKAMAINQYLRSRTQGVRVSDPKGQTIFAKGVLRNADSN